MTTIETNAHAFSRTQPQTVEKAGIPIDHKDNTIDMTPVAIESAVHLASTLIGLIGHILVILITCMYCRKWRSLHYLLLGLSSVELLMLLGYTPLHLYSIISPRWGLPSEVCTFAASFLHTGSGLTTGFKTIMGLSRLILCSSEQIYIKCFRKELVIGFMIIWTVIVLLVVDLSLMIGIVAGDYSMREHQCSLFVPQKYLWQLKAISTNSSDGNATTAMMHANISDFMNMSTNSTERMASVSINASDEIANISVTSDDTFMTTHTPEPIDEIVGKSNHLLMYASFTGIFFFIVTAINSISYTVVYCKIKCVQTQEKVRHNRDCREILISVILAYTNLLLFWMPWIIFNIIDVHHTWLPVSLHKVAFYLHMLNYTTDPFVYAFRATDYKLGFFLLCNRHLEAHASGRSDDMYNIDFNDLGEEYNNNLSEVVKQMKTADEDGFAGIVKKQTIHRAKLRFQSSISQIIRDHRQQQELRAKLNRIRSQSTKTTPVPSPDGPRRDSNTMIVHKWKRAVTIVRVRDLINLNIEDVVIPDQHQQEQTCQIEQQLPLQQSQRNIKNLRVNLKDIGRENQQTVTDDNSPGPKSV